MKGNRLVPTLLAAAFVLAGFGPVDRPYPSSSDRPHTVSPPPVAAIETSFDPSTQIERNPSQETALARIGFWRPSLFSALNAAQWRLSPAQIKTMYDKLRRISDALRGTPILQSTVGFEAKAYHSVGSSVGSSEKELATSLPPSSVLLMLFDYYQTCATCPIKPVGESRASLALHINDLNAFYDTWQTPLEKDAEGGIYVEPMRRGEFGGFPLYQPPGKQPRVLLTSDDTRPIWVPVSQERFIRAKIAKWQQVISKIKPPNDRIGRETIAALEEELARLSPTERAGPSYMADGPSSRASRLHSANDRGAQALVATNPAFFELRRGRTSFQVAALTTYPVELMTKSGDAYIQKKLLEAMKAVDWKQIAALLQ